MEMASEKEWRELMRHVVVGHAALIGPLGGIRYQCGALLAEGAQGGTANCLLTGRCSTSAPMKLPVSCAFSHSAIAASSFSPRSHTYT